MQVRLNTAGITERHPGESPRLLVKITGGAIRGGVALSPHPTDIVGGGLVMCYFVGPCDGGDTISPDSVSVLQMVI